MTRIGEYIGILCLAAAVPGAGIAGSGIDTDGDGRYSLAELQALYPALTAAIYALIDADGDGRVSPGEFRAGQDEGLLVSSTSNG
jgi:hypothetical protein